MCTFFVTLCSSSSPSCAHTHTHNISAWKGWCSQEGGRCQSLQLQHAQTPAVAFPLDCHFRSLDDFHDFESKDVPIEPKLKSKLGFFVCFFFKNTSFLVRLRTCIWTHRFGWEPKLSSKLELPGTRLKTNVQINKISTADQFYDNTILLQTKTKYLQGPVCVI